MQTLTIYKVKHKKTGKTGFVFEHVWDDTKEKEFLTVFGSDSDVELIGLFVKKELELCK